MDRICIQSLPVECRIGVPDEERRETQRLLIGLELATDLSPAGRSDDFSAAIDYAAVADTVLRVAADRPRRLIETLAEDVAVEVLAEHGADSVRVRVEKPRALQAYSATFAAVEIERSRPG